MKLARKLILISKILLADVNNYFAVPKSLLNYIKEQAKKFLKSGEKHKTIKVDIENYIQQWKYLELFKKNKKRDSFSVDFYRTKDISGGRTYNITDKTDKQGIQLFLQNDEDLNNIAIQHELQHILRYNILPAIFNKYYGNANIEQIEGIRKYLTSFAEYVEQVGTCINIFKLIYKKVKDEYNVNQFFKQVLFDKYLVYRNFSHDFYIRYCKSIMFLETLKQLQPSKYKKALKQIYQDLKHEQISNQ